MALNIPRIDARQQQALPLLQSLRDRLSLDGDVASPRSRKLTEQVFGEPLSPTQVTERICREVKRDRDQALCRYSELLDQHQTTPSQLRVPAERLIAAHRQASPAFLEAVRRIRDAIEGFQRAIVHSAVVVTPKVGVRLQQRYHPLKRVGICVPGGAAAYPSTVLMTAVPALVAGVKEIVMMAPPTGFGAYNDDVLAVCQELGVQEIYAVGGAQGVAALAYGTDTIPAVDKIVGPGNIYVALAKKFVYGQVDIDSIAGPSEVVILADRTAPPDFLASDLLAQAEHSPGSSLLVTWEEGLIDQVLQELERQLPSLERSGLTRDSLESFGAFIQVRDREQGVEIANAFAPEHLEIVCSEPYQLADAITNAGATFIGPYSPVAVGDYAAGPSHVLPTSGTARWASGLNVNSFLRSSSVIEFQKGALDEVLADVSLLANKEGLTAHRKSLEIRSMGRHE